jgi:hypothetical protein
MEHAMTNETLRQALACASRGWPVFPCMAGRKIPLTRHGFRDATTDEQRITAWFGSRPDWNLAIATGAPGPDVLDVDDHGPAGNGYLAFATLTKTGLVDGAAAYVRTPSGGLHAYFRGSDQRNGHLPAHHPPSQAAVIVSADQAKTLLAALDEAAEYKRDGAETCADCADQSCTTCQWRRQAADTYDQLASQIIHTAEAATRQHTPDHPAPPSAGPHAAADKEAGR